MNRQVFSSLLYTLRSDAWPMCKCREVQTRGGGGEQNKLWRTVLWGVFVILYAASQSEVCHLGTVVFSDQDIAGRQVTVDEFLFLQKSHSGRYLEEGRRG